MRPEVLRLRIEEINGQFDVNHESMATIDDRETSSCSKVKDTKSRIITKSIDFEFIYFLQIFLYASQNAIQFIVTMTLTSERKRDSERRNYLIISKISRRLGANNLNIANNNYLI